MVSWSRLPPILDRTGIAQFMITEQKYSGAGLNAALISRISAALTDKLSVADCAVLLERGPQIAAGIAKERPALAEVVGRARDALPW